MWAPPADLLFLLARPSNGDAHENNAPPAAIRNGGMDDTRHRKDAEEGHHDRPAAVQDGVRSSLAAYVFTLTPLSGC